MMILGQNNNTKGLGADRVIYLTYFLTLPPLPLYFRLSVCLPACLSAFVTLSLSLSLSVCVSFSSGNLPAKYIYRKTSRFKISIQSNFIRDSIRAEQMIDIEHASSSSVPSLSFSAEVNLGALLRYSLVADEDVKKPINQPSKQPTKQKKKNKHRANRREAYIIIGFFAVPCLFSIQLSLRS